MQRVTRGTIHLYTFKEGVLSAMAHDLRLTVKRFRIELDRPNFRGVFMPNTIQVDGAMNKGKLNEKALSDKDRSKIRSTMLGEVLKASTTGDITYEGTVSEEGVVLVARGDLTLAGKTKPLDVTMRRTAEGVRGEVEIQPSNWGIKPYKALGGTLKLQDRVRIAFELPDS